MSNSCVLVRSKLEYITNNGDIINEDVVQVITRLNTTQNSNPTRNPCDARILYQHTNGASTSSGFGEESMCC